MILPTSNQCGTLFVYPTILPSNKGPSSLPSNDYPSAGFSPLPTRILRSNALEAHALHGSTTCLESLLYPRSTPLHRVGTRTHPWRIRSTPPVKLSSSTCLPWLTIFVRNSEDSSTWVSSNLALIPLVKDSGHHISPQWYDIFHFGPKPSWICFWALPQNASYQWRYFVHPYIPIILPTSNQCGTFFVYPTILPSN